MLKKFISVCTDGASINIGCDNSLFTRLFEEHSHQLELVIEESVAKRLLNDIKECLMNLILLIQ